MNVDIDPRTAAIKALGAAGDADRADLIRWTTGGESNIHPGDQILDQGEMCTVKGVYVESLDDGSYWMHVELRDPRRADGRSFVHEYSGSDLVAVIKPDPAGVSAEGDET